MFLPDKNYIVLADIMHDSYGKVPHRQKVDSLDLSFKSSKNAHILSIVSSLFHKIFSSYMKNDQN